MDGEVLDGDALDGENQPAFQVQIVPTIRHVELRARKGHPNSASSNVQNGVVGPLDTPFRTMGPHVPSNFPALCSICETTLHEPKAAKRHFASKSHKNRKIRFLMAWVDDTSDISIGQWKIDCPLLDWIPPLSRGTWIRHISRSNSCPNLNDLPALSIIYNIDNVDGDFDECFDRFASNMLGTWCARTRTFDTDNDSLLNKRTSEFDDVPHPSSPSSPSIIAVDHSLQELAGLQTGPLLNRTRTPETDNDILSLKRTSAFEGMPYPLHSRCQDWNDASSWDFDDCYGFDHGYEDAGLVEDADDF